MSNLFDYLTWRGDLGFEADPFNDVDSLILCCLCYVHFSGIVPDTPDAAGIPLSQAAERFFALPADKQIVHVEDDRSLLRAMAQTKRFGNIRLTHHIDHFDPEQEKQFSATTFRLNDDLSYLAFRGTDGTLVGWKEDFNMTFMPAVASQTAALSYLESTASALPGSFIPGGHSKGGNLAIYAAAMSSPKTKDRISLIYNHDGPGFDKEMMSGEGYRSIVGRIRTLIPQSSVIGMLLDHEEEYTIIHSNQVGLMQHIPYTWEVSGPSLVPAASTTPSSRIIDRSLKEWIGSMTPEQRSEFVNGLYEIFGSTDAVMLSELPLAWIKNFDKVSKAWKDTNPDTKKMYHQIISRLFKATREAVRAQGFPKPEFPGR